MYADAGQKTSGLCIETVEGAWEKLPDTRFGVGGSSMCSQNLETLFVRGIVPGIQRSQKLKIFVWSEGAEYEAEALDGIPEGLRLWVVILVTS